MATDPVVKYTAGAILVIAFIAACVVAVHGYLVDPNYVVPSVVTWVLGSAVTGALTLLGVHVGNLGVQTGAKIANGRREDT